MSVTSRFPRRLAAIVLSASLLGVVAPAVSLSEPAAAIEVTNGGFVTSGRTSPGTVTAGQTITLTASVRSDASRRALIDLEVYDRAGRKVYQQYWDNQTFQAGTARQFTASWTTPSSLAAGSYTVKVGVFSVGWGTLRHWNNDAARFTVGSGSSTTTQPPAPTTTRPPTTTTPPTTTRPPTTTVPPSTTTPPTSGRFNTLPVGAKLPSGAECAARVRPAPEIRPENATANAERGGRAYANNRTDWSGFDRVDGDFAGTTDQIIQWAACKWGIDEDIVRAQVIKESYWYQSANGDNGESWGLGQVRDTAHPSAFEFAAVNARNSSAYNLDYTYASWRACFEGVYTWLNTVERNGTYGPGDVWGCIGIWFSGRWYVGNDAYLNQQGDSVRWHFNNRTWLTSAFING